MSYYSYLMSFIDDLDAQIENLYYEAACSRADGFKDRAYALYAEADDLEQRSNAIWHKACKAVDA